jgi:hypothetical protein
MSDRGHSPSSVAANVRPAKGDESVSAKPKIEQLDFGVRNTLLYYRDLKATLDLTPGSGVNQSALDRLLGAERVPVSELFDTGPDALRDATKRVRAISYRARRDLDKGAPGTLCVTWGMATWDNGRTTVPAAPILLRQASVGRHPGTAEDFDLGVTGPWSLNTTLLRLLEVDFGVDVERDALDALLEELTGHRNPAHLFKQMTTTAAAVPGFSITPRVVLAPVPRAVMVVDRGPTPAVEKAVAPVVDPVHVVEDATVPVAEDATVPVADPVPVSAVAPAAEVAVAPMEPAAIDAGTGEATEDVLELFRTGELDPTGLAEGTSARRILEQFGPDVVMAEISATLHGDNWPEALIEHTDSGLRVRHGTELIQRWYDASRRRPQSSGWDATHFALWGLASAPTAGIPAIQAVAQWGDRRDHPVLIAWQLVAERRLRHRSRPGRRLSFKSHRLAIPKGIDEALWGLPVELLVEWASWVFRQWPGAPIELILPTGTAELVGAWYERARPVTELAVKTWVTFSPVDDDLDRSAQRWVKQLAGACDGAGEPLATWFEKSREAATAAVARRVGVTIPPRSRPTRGGDSVSHAEHAI